MAVDRRRSLLASLACLIVACAACGRADPVGTPPRGAPAVTSPTLGPSIYFEEGSLVFFAVNSHLARFQLKEPLIPLEIAVANKGLQRLTVGLEGITLRDRAGHAWAAATPAESLGRSLRSEFDRSLMPVDFREVVQLRFSAYRPVPANYGLRPGDHVMTRTAEMTRNTWMYAQVWFPHPGGELKGKTFEVWLTARELPQPVFTTIAF